jgi:cell division transport system permease protein
MSYALKTGLLGLWREKWINLLSMMTIGAALFLISLAGIFVYNLDRAAQGLPDRFTVMVFFKDTLEDEAARQGAERLRNIAVVEDVRYISANDALKELSEAMKDADYVLEGLEGNPLPASAEIRLKKDSVSEEGINELSTRLSAIDEVEDYQYGDKLLDVIRSAQRYTKTLSLALVVVLSLGVVFVCYSTVKILFYRKQDEIETLKFLGATRGFIRSPFVIEGSVLGLGGGFFSALATLCMYYLVFARFAETLPILQSVQMPAFLLVLSLPAGLLVGTVGAVLAVGSLRF